MVGPVKQRRIGGDRVLRPTACCVRPGVAGGLGLLGRSAGVTYAGVACAGAAELLTRPGWRVRVQSAPEDGGRAFTRNLVSLRFGLTGCWQRSSAGVVAGLARRPVARRQQLRLAAEGRLDCVFGCCFSLTNLPTDEQLAEVECW